MATISALGDVVELIHEASWETMPTDVRARVKHCLLDTLGAGLAARRTDASRIMHDFAATTMGGRGALLWQDGREVSPAGAALANGHTVDALDIHDGHSLTKGHAGAAIVPATLATIALGKRPVSGQECLTTLAIGYEVALRAGIALHGTADDYHSSGSWNALGCAAVTARRLALSADETLHALGTAEFHGPRSQIMRCVDHPTMVKDGSGWGAMVGVSAALLAQAGFTGRPAVTIERDEMQNYWSDLGHHWELLRQYFKPHAVCRWAQPAVEAVIKLTAAHTIRPEAIRRVRVITFHEATRLSTQRPTTTEEAQYSLPFAVAAALAHGQLRQDQLTGAALADPRVLRLLELIEVSESDDYSRKFPAKRFADVVIETHEGASHELKRVEPAWDADAPPTEEEIVSKFRALAYFLPEREREGLVSMVMELDRADDRTRPWFRC